MRKLLVEYWRITVATVVLVVVAVTAIVTLVQRPSFTMSYTGQMVTCPSMVSPTSGQTYGPYSYGSQVSGLSDEDVQEYLSASGFDTLTDDALGRAQLRIDANLAQACSDLKASQQGRLMAILGFGVLILAFLAVPVGRPRRAGQV